MRVAFFDHDVRGAYSTLQNSIAQGFGIQDHARAQDSNAAEGNTKNMEATSADLLRKVCQVCSETIRPSRPALQLQPSGAIVGFLLYEHVVDSANGRVHPVLGIFTLTLRSNGDGGGCVTQVIRRQVEQCGGERRGWRAWDSGEHAPQ